MADVKRRRLLSEARSDAADLREMLLPYVERWEVAGSVRRGRAQVGDVDHVVVPRYEARDGGGLFGGDGDVERVNLLWQALDGLVDTGLPADCLETGDAGERWEVRKAVRDTKAGPRMCWGDRQRAVFFRGYEHELFVSEPEALGIAMLIRTGPADFSRYVVTELRKHGYRAEGGRVVRMIGGDYAGVIEAGEPEVVEVRDERAVFDLIGMSYREPGDREGRW